MAIIGSLPNNIQDGQLVDASPVMADFNYIVNQVNANANPSGTLTAPSGTTIPMAQAAAPAGWTSSTISDTSLRYNSTSGGSGGGSVGWSAWNFGGSFNVNTFTLSSAQLAPHAHGVNDPTHAHSSPGHAHTPASGYEFWTSSPSGGASTTLPGGSFSQNLEVGTNDVAVTINNASTGITIQTTGSGAGITPTFNTPQVLFIDHIMAVKS
jgi:hypothetical protein